MKTKKVRLTLDGAIASNEQKFKRLERELLRGKVKPKGKQYEPLGLLDCRPKAGR